METAAPKKKKRRTKAQKEISHRARVLIVVLIVIALLALLYFFTDTAALFAAFRGEKEEQSATPADSLYLPIPSPMPEGDFLDMYFIDVGQGDCTLLISPSGKTMLVDAGDGEHSLRISHYLELLDIDRIDVLIATHPHSDHIGGMRQIINSYDIGAFYIPDAETSTTAYDGMMAALWDNNINSELLAAGQGQSIPWDDEVTVDILSPFLESGFVDLNNESLILKLTYKNNSLLLTGDAEYDEQSLALKMLGADAFDADVIKVPHHGSEDGAYREFLSAVSPRVAVISCGAGNDYGHPHETTLSLYRELGAAVYRTDKNGTVRVIMTGENIVVTPSVN